MLNYLTWLIIVTLPFQFALNVGDEADILFVRVLIPIVFLLWLLRGLGKKNITIPYHKVTVLWLLFIFFTTFSLLFAIKPELGTRKMLYYLSVLPLFFVAADIFRKKSARETGLRILIFSGLLGALIGIGQFASQFFFGLNPVLGFFRKIAPLFLGQSFSELVVQSSSWLVNLSGHTVLRAFGFFADPHIYSFFEALILFVALGYFTRAKKGKGKIISGFALVCMTSAVALSFSRGAYLGVAAGAVFFVVLLLFKKGGLKKILLISGILLIIALTASQTAIFTRLSSSFNLKEGSNLERMKNWKQALKITRDYPLTGAGLGNYALLINPGVKERSSIYAHNTYLDIAAETGLTNILVFTLLILFTIKRQIQLGSPVNLGIAAALVYFLTHSFFDTALFSPQVLSVLLIILALGMYSFKEKQKQFV